MQRRTYIGTVVAAAVSLGDWIPGLSSDDEQTPEYANEPASSIQQYPLQHGQDVDTPADAHHVQPSAGAFLTTVDDGFDLQVTKEVDTWTLTTLSNGTHTFSMASDYDITFAHVFLEVAGSVLSDVRANPSSWVTNNDGTISGVDVVWTNASGDDQTARVEVLGLQK